MKSNQFLGQCQALTFRGNKCPSQAHEEMVVGVKNLVFCSHHLGIVKAILTHFKVVEVSNEKG